MVRIASIALASLVLLAGPALAKKKYKHPLGFRVELPDGWTVEEAPSGATIAPAGVKIDPNREDNPEVYTLWVAEQDKSSEKEYVQSLRDRFKVSGTKVDREGDVEPMSVMGKAGVVYTFDFIHPERKGPYRIRIFAMQHKGRPLMLIATGVRDKVASRDGALREIARSIAWQ